MTILLGIAPSDCNMPTPGNPGYINAFTKARVVQVVRFPTPPALPITYTVPMVGR